MPDKRINKDKLAREKFIIDEINSNRAGKSASSMWKDAPPSQEHSWAKVLGENNSGKIIPYGEYNVEDLFDIENGYGTIRLWDKNKDKYVGTTYYMPKNKASAYDAVNTLDQGYKKGLLTRNDVHYMNWKKDIAKEGGVLSPVFSNRIEDMGDIEGPSASKEIVPYDRNFNKKDKDLEKTLWKYLSEERPYVPLKYYDVPGKPIFKERYSSLKALAKKLGYSGLKMLPWAATAASISTGDVMGAVPGIGDLLSSEDVGAGSDQVPFEYKYTPKPVLPDWLQGNR